MLQDKKSVYTEYPDPRHDEWKAKIRPALQNARLLWLCAKTPFSKRTLI